MRPKQDFAAIGATPGSPLTSGDLRADRRYLRARDLAQEGDHAAAADLLEQTLELAPAWPAAWFALGRERRLLADRSGAIAALSQALALDPADRLGASLALAALGAQAPSAAAPAAYVADLFDEYAARFDGHLLGELGYRAPQLLRAALDAVAPAPRRFARALDLGCGTGLGGAALRDRVERLEGVDLSANMVRAAAARGLYDALSTGDIMDALARAGAREGVGAPDLLLAADVLIYIGALPPVLAAARAALASGGLFALTLQRAGEGEGVRVGADLRFAHAPDYVRTCAREAGFAVVWWDLSSTRRDGGADVPSLVIVLEACGAPATPAPA